LKHKKIRNTGFIGNLILSNSCEFYYDTTVSSFINHKYGNITDESIPFCYSFSDGQNDFDQMPFTLRCVQYMVTSVLQDWQYMFGVRSLLMDEKVLLMKKTWPMCCFDD